MKLAPGQRGSLTAYGQLASSIAPSGMALRSVHGQQQPTCLSSTTGNDSLKGQRSAAESSRRDASQGGQRLQANPQPDRGRISFSDLASQNGVRKWTDETFDDRWVLRSDEMWNVDPRRRSVITVSPSPKSSAWYTDAHTRTQEAYARAQARTVSVPRPTARQMQDVFFGTLWDRRARSSRKFTGQDAGQPNNALAAYAARLSLNSPQVGSRTLTPTLYGLVNFSGRLNFDYTHMVQRPCIAPGSEAARKNIS